MAISVSKGFMAATALAVGIGSVALLNSDADDSRQVIQAMDDSYKASSCHNIQNTKQINQCMTYLDGMAASVVTQVNRLSAVKAVGASTEDRVLQTLWVLYACDVGPVNSLSKFSEKVAPCLDAAAKIAKHFNIEQADTFGKITEKLKEQMRDAAKQAPLPTKVMI